MGFARVLNCAIELRQISCARVLNHLAQSGHAHIAFPANNLTLMIDLTDALVLLIVGNRVQFT